MPRRLIDSRIYSNEKYGELPMGAKELLKSIVTHADEDGRLKAGGKFLRSITFPYNEEISSVQVEEWRDLLHEAGFIRAYGCNGDRYCDVPGWQDPKSEFHQVLRKDRYTPSVLPPFQAGDNQVATTGQPADNPPATAGTAEDKVSQGKVSYNSSPNGELPASTGGPSELPQEAPPASSVRTGEAGTQPEGQTSAEPETELPGHKSVRTGEASTQPGGQPGAEPQREPPKDKSVRRGEAGTQPRTLTSGQRQKQSNVGLVLQAVRDHYGYPDKTDTDPIPNYGKEGKAISRILTRGFTLVQIVECWKKKVAQHHGDFVSFTFVNEDIGKEPTNGFKGPTTRASTPRRTGPRFGGYAESLHRRRAGPGAAGVSAVPGREVRPPPEGGQA